MNRSILTLLLTCASFSLFSQNNPATNAANIVSILGVFNGPCDGCEQDMDQDGEVNAADLVAALNSYGFIPLDIVPRWYTYFNDQPAGLTVIPTYCTIRDSDLTWDDIKDQCVIEWIKDGEIQATGLDVMLIDIAAICNGSFPLTMRITYEGTIFERTGIMKVGTVWLEDAQDCGYGYSVLDADLSTYEMNPYFNPDSDEDENYQYFVNFSGF